MEKRKPNDLSPDQCLAVDTESLYHEFSCPLERSAREGIFVRDLMLTEPCPFRAQQHTKHREVSAYAKS